MSKELSVTEATRRLGVGIDATYKLLYSGKLPARKVDGRWLIRADAVEARLRARVGRQQSSAANSELAGR